MDGLTPLGIPINAVPALFFLSLPRSVPPTPTPVLCISMLYRKSGQLHFPISMADVITISGLLEIPTSYTMEPFL